MTNQVHNAAGKRSSDDIWTDPEDIIPLKAGYDWRRYSQHGSYFLCLDGRPLEVQGRYGNWWRPCTFDPAGDELKAFAAAMQKSCGTIT